MSSSPRRQKPEKCLPAPRGQQQSPRSRRPCLELLREHEGQGLQQSPGLSDPHQRRSSILRRSASSWSPPPRLTSPPLWDSFPKLSPDLQDSAWPRHTPPSKMLTSSSPNWPRLVCLCSEACPLPPGQLVPSLGRG